MKELTTSIPSRLLPSEYIEIVSSSTIDDYIHDYVTQRYTQIPYRPYAEKSELDKFIDIWADDSNAYITRLKKNHELLKQGPLPLALAKDLSFQEKIAGFINAIQKDADTYYPLISNEKFISSEVFYLSKSWQGLQAGTLVYLRKTDLSHIYFVIPDIILNLKDNEILSSKIHIENDLNVIDKPVSSSFTSINHSLQNISFRRANTSGSNGINLALDVIGDLAWATPYGPFVAAVITLGRALFGPQDTRPNLEDVVIGVGKQVISRLEYISATTEITKKTDVIHDFTAWLQTAKQRLDNQDVQAIRIALVESNGIFAQLNKHLGTGPDTLHGIITSLLADGDLSLDKTEAYTSKQNWEIASAKLECLCLTISLYLFAIKTKMELVGDFFTVGYNTLGEKIPDNDPINHDNTSQVFISEVNRFTDGKLVPAIIVNVRNRRLGMIQKPVTASCEANVSVTFKETKEEAGKWFDKRTSKDSFYTFVDLSRTIRFYRMREKSQPMDNDFRTNVGYRKWQLLGFYDIGADDGEKMIDFNLDDGGENLGASVGFHSNPAAVDFKRKLYMNNTIQREELLQWDNLPSQWLSKLEEWKKKVTPGLPNDIDGIIITDNWQEHNPKDIVWSNKSLEVRYLYKFVNFFQESVLTNDHTSTQWTYANNRSQPEIIGFPTEHPTLTYVTSIHIYRQFRLSFDIVTTPQRIGVNKRDVKTGYFSQQYVDKTPPTDNELAQLKLSNNKPTNITHINLFTNNAEKKEPEISNVHETSFADIKHN